AKGAARHRVILVAAHLDELAVLNLVDHGAGIRTVVRTPAEERFALRLLVHALNPPFAAYRCWLFFAPTIQAQPRGRGSLMSIIIPNEPIESAGRPIRQNLGWRSAIGAG